MKILVCGKGGSGKSTVSSLLAKEIAERGNRVLVVDTDSSNFGLYKQLGFEQPKDFMESLGGKKALVERMLKYIKSEEKESLNILDEFSIKDIPQELIVGDDSIRLVAIGKIHSFGEGCACPMGTLSKEFLEKLKTNGEHVIVDTDAGIEHFGHGVEAGCDKIVVVLDPSYESVQLSAKISKMAEKIEKPVIFILNKMDENSTEFVNLVDNKKVIGKLPFDKDVFKACMKGDTVPHIQEMKGITDKLLAV